MEAKCQLSFSWDMFSRIMCCLYELSIRPGQPEMMDGPSYDLINLDGFHICPRPVRKPWYTLTVAGCPYLRTIFFFLLSWNVDATLLLHFLIIFPHCSPTDRSVSGITDVYMPISFICTVPNNTQWVILVLCCKVERAFHSLSTSALEVRLFWSLQSKTGTGGTSRYFQRHFALRSSPNNWKACYGIVSQPGVREKREKSETLIRIKLDSSWL